MGKKSIRTYTQQQIPWSVNCIMVFLRKKSGWRFFVVSIKSHIYGKDERHWLQISDFGNKNIDTKIKPRYILKRIICCIPGPVHTCYTILEQAPDNFVQKNPFIRCKIS